MTLTLTLTPALTQVATRQLTVNAVGHAAQLTVGWLDGQRITVTGNRDDNSNCDGDGDTLRAI